MSSFDGFCCLYSENIKDSKLSNRQKAKRGRGEICDLPLDRVNSYGKLAQESLTVLRCKLYRPSPV